jgi:hypothetical protein
LIFGLGVLGWPVFSFGAIFMFDSPISGPADAAQRYAFAFLTWLYPLIYGAAWLLYRRMKKREMSESVRLLIWILPAIAPAYYVWFFSRGA